MNRKAAFVMILLLIAALSFSETVYLKNGDVLSGTIIETKEKSIVIETQQGKLEILKQNIAKIDYSAQTPSTLRDKNDALIWRPLPTLVGAMMGYFEFVFEGQTAFSREWAVTSIVDIGSIDGLFVVSLQLGPQYRINGNYLKGFLLGLYPGIGYVTDFIDRVWFFSLTFETGYQWVFNSGFVLGLTTGGSYLSNSPYANAFKFNISAHVGYAFKNAWIRAKQ